MNKNILPENYKNTKQIINIFLATIVGFSIYFVWGLWTLFVDSIVYDKSLTSDYLAIKSILGFTQALLIHIAAGIIILIDMYFFVPIYKVFVKKEDKFNSCHFILLILIIISIPGIYFAFYAIEAYYQNGNIPYIFSKNSLHYFLGGFLKTFPVLCITMHGVIIDIFDNEANKEIYPINDNI